MVKRWITGAVALGLITGSLALVACGHDERVTRTTTTEQTTTAAPAPMMAPMPGQTTTTETTRRSE